MDYHLYAIIVGKQKQGIINKLNFLAANEYS